MSTDKVDSRSAKLREVAKVQPGYLSRKGVRPAPNGTHRLLQAKDVSPEIGVQLDEAIRFQPERRPELYEVSRGDLLVAARGQDHRAYLVTEEPRNALASSFFYIVRPRSKRVLPEYLAWWLNLPDVQAKIDANSPGTSIPYLSREALEGLEVPVPPLPVQTRIGRIVGLWREQKVLQSRLAEKREHQIQAVCRQAVHQAKE